MVEVLSNCNTTLQAHVAKSNEEEGLFEANCLEVCYRQGVESGTIPYHPLYYSNTNIQLRLSRFTFDVSRFSVIANAIYSLYYM